MRILLCILISVVIYIGNNLLGGEKSPNESIIYWILPWILYWFSFLYE